MGCTAQQLSLNLQNLIAICIYCVCSFSLSSYFSICQIKSEQFIFNFSLTYRSSFSSLQVSSYPGLLLPTCCSPRNKVEGPSLSEYYIRYLYETPSNSVILSVVHAAAERRRHRLFCHAAAAEKTNGVIRR